MPAPPNSSAYTDQPNDAPTPTLTSVSIVAAPWPSPYHAARCSGQAPHTATGAASARLTHCQPVNCADGRHHQHDDRHRQRDTDGEPPPQRPGCRVSGGLVRAGATGGSAV